MSEQKKLIFAVIASFTFFFIFDTFFPSQVKAPVQTTQHAPDTAVAKSEGGSSSAQQAGTLDRVQALSADQRVIIHTPLLKGSINLTGALLDDLELVAYKETSDEKSSAVVLFSPLHTKTPYFSHISYASSLNDNACASSQTVWKVVSDNKTLSANAPVVLSAKVGAIEYKREISVDDQYLFTIKDTLVNTSKETVNLSPNAVITRVGTPQTSGFFVLHEGGVGVLNHKLAEFSYEDMSKKGNIQETSVNGWHGFTDKYWLSAIIPDAKDSVTASYQHDQNNYYAKTIGSNRVIEAGKTVEVTHHLYAGAKVLRMLDGYEVSHKFDRFDLAVDFGWFYFLTKPLFYVLDFLNKFFGNMGIAIILLTVLFKILTLPLANKSSRSMAKLKTLQPKMERLQAQHGNDKMRLNQEIMALYKKEKANPVSGCLPMLLQAPIFFCLYKVFFVTIEMRHAPFFGWIQDLSAPDPTTLFNLFGLLPFDPPSFLMIGAWPLLMGVTMVMQQKMSPQPADPQQAKVMMIMPIMFTFMFASFPAGLVIYWAWSNILTISHQWYMGRVTAAESSTITIHANKSANKNPKKK